MKARLLIQGLMAVAVLAMPVLASGQDYDDIYYNPSKPAKASKKKITVKNYVPTADYPAADSYQSDFSTQPLTRDVDEYNRHTAYKAADTVTVNADTLGEFLYTRRLERFHNPDVVNQTSDPDLIDYYYSQPAQSASNVNIYVNANPWYAPYYSSWDWPYYGWSYSCNPWYWNTWWPSYSWGWRPGWSWGWGPSWGYNPWYDWGWSGPIYRPPYPGGWRPGWNHGWRPSSPGASRPHYATGGAGSGRRPGSYNSNLPSAGNRPGSMGTGSYSGGTRYQGSSNGQYRPGSMGTGSYRPGNNGNGSSRPGISTSRPGSMGTGSYQGSSSRGRNNYGSSSSSSSSSRRNSSSSYNSGSRSSYSSGSYGGSSRGSYSSGSFGGGRSSGGSYGGGGGGGSRGRGR